MDKNLLVEPKSKLNFNNKAFSVYAPSLWNNISFETRNSPDKDTFRKGLKTELFDRAFSE